MKGKPEKKRASAGTVKLKEVIEDTVAMIRRIDKNDDYDQSEKTRRHRALASSVKNKLHEDGRKKEENKVSVTTFRRYLTDVRRAISEENWHHHGLNKKLDVLARRYPNHAEKILSIRCENIDDTRKRYKEVLGLLVDDSAAHGDLSGVILDHEIMRHLTLDSAKKAKIADAQSEALTAKKTSTIDVEYDWLIVTINSLLKPDLSKRISYGRLATGIAFATGRRAIEVVYQGRFEKAGEYELDFTGAAKKRGGADYSRSYRIYTILPADEVLKAIALLREQPEIKALERFEGQSETQRNMDINRNVAKTLNEAAKRIWGSDERIFRDTRPVWARLVFEEHFSNDKRWAKVDEDVFWHEMLCHDDVETQKSYKQFKIIRNAPGEDSTGSDRLSAVKELAKHPAVMKRGALAKITAWAVKILESNPDAKITQHRIITEVGSGRAVIKDWLTLAAAALNMPVAALPQKTAKKTEEKEPKKPAEKPRVSASELANGVWEVLIKVGDQESLYEYQDCSKMEAMQQAWKEHKTL